MDRNASNKAVDTTNSRTDSASKKMNGEHHSTTTNNNDKSSSFSMIFTGDTVAFSSSNNNNNDNNGDDNGTTASSTLFLSTTQTAASSPGARSMLSSCSPQAKSPIRCTSKKAFGNSPSNKSLSSPFSDRDVNESNYLDSAHFLDATAPLLVMSQLEPKQLDPSLGRALEKENNRNEKLTTNDHESKSSLAFLNKQDKATEADAKQEINVDDAEMEDSEQQQDDDDDDDDDMSEDEGIQEEEDCSDDRSSSSALVVDTSEEQDDDHDGGMFFTQAFDTQDEDFRAMPPPPLPPSSSREQQNATETTNFSSPHEANDESDEDEKNEKEQSEKEDEASEQQNVEEDDEDGNIASTKKATGASSTSLKMSDESVTTTDPAIASNISQINSPTDGEDKKEAGEEQHTSKIMNSFPSSIASSSISSPNEGGKPQKGSEHDVKDEKVIAFTKSTKSSSRATPPHTATKPVTLNATAATAAGSSSVPSPEDGDNTEKSETNNFSQIKGSQKPDHVFVTPGLTTVKKKSPPQDAPSSDLGKGRTLNLESSVKDKSQTQKGDDSKMNDASTSTIKTRSDEPNDENEEGGPSDDEEEEEEVPTQVMSVQDVLQDGRGGGMFDNAMYDEEGLGESQLSLSTSTGTKNDHGAKETTVAKQPSSATLKSTLMCLTSNTTTLSLSQNNDLFYNGGSANEQQPLDLLTESQCSQSQTQLELMDKLMNTKGADSCEKRDTVAMAVVAAMEERGCSKNDISKDVKEPEEENSKNKAEEKDIVKKNVTHGTTDASVTIVQTSASLSGCHEDGSINDDSKNPASDSKSAGGVTKTTPVLQKTPMDNTPISDIKKMEHIVEHSLAKKKQDSVCNSGGSKWLSAHTPSSRKKSAKAATERGEVSSSSGAEARATAASASASAASTNSSLMLNESSSQKGTSTMETSLSNDSLLPLEDTQEDEEDAPRRRSSISPPSSLTRLKKVGSTGSNSSSTTKKVANTTSTGQANVATSETKARTNKKSSSTPLVVEQDADADSEEEESQSQWINDEKRSSFAIQKNVKRNVKPTKADEEEGTMIVEEEVPSHHHHEEDMYSMTQEEELMLQRRNEQRLKVQQQEEVLRKMQRDNKTLKEVLEVKEVKEICRANQDLLRQVSELKQQLSKLTEEKKEADRDAAKWKRKCQYTMDENDSLKQELEIANALRQEQEKRIQTIMGAAGVAISATTISATTISACNAPGTSAKSKSSTSSVSSSKKKKTSSSSSSLTGRGSSSASYNKRNHSSLVYDEEKTDEMTGLASFIASNSATKKKSKKKKQQQNDFDNDETQTDLDEDSDDDERKNELLEDESKDELSSELSMSQESRIDFEGYWTRLKEKGWKYRSGPEPYNQVYVPPGGSVKMGSKNNVHFYTDYDEAIKRAVEMGHIEMTEKQKMKLFGTVSSSGGSADTKVSSSKNKGQNHGRHPNEKKKTEVIDVDAIDDNDDGSVMDVETVDTSKEEEEEYIPLKSDTAENANEAEPSQSQKLIGGNGDGEQGLFVPEALQSCLQTTFRFFRTEEDGQHFISEVWKPIWNVLQNQHDYLSQDNTVINALGDVNWKYMAGSSRKLMLLGSSWIFGVPNTKGVKDGIEGIDFFVREKAVVARMLDEVDVSKLSVTQREIHKRALTFCQSDLITSDNTTSNRRKRSRTPSNKLVMGVARGDNVGTVASARKSVAKSRNTTNASSKVATKDKTASATATVATPHVSDHYEKKQKVHHCASSTSSNNNSTGSGSSTSTNKKTPPTTTAKEISPSYHLTQSPVASAKKDSSVTKSRQDALLASAVKRRLNNVSSSTSTSPSDPSKTKVLDGMIFLISGCPEGTEAEVAKLGGLCITSMDGMSTSREVIGGKVCFLSAPQYRRRHKYLLAVALGLPMFHYRCMEDLKQQEEEYQRTLKEMKNMEHQDNDDPPTRPALFDTMFYKKWRLPTGLSLQTGMFVMQRARDASKWAPPGFERIKDDVTSAEYSKQLFDGMSFALALDDEENEHHWMKMILALGGTLISRKKIREGTGMPTIILVDALNLPPHVTAIPSRVEGVLKHVSDSSSSNTTTTTTVLDLSWFIQCMIERTKLPYDRYCISSEGTSNYAQNSSTLMSIKIQEHTNAAPRRYQVGDTVKVQLTGGSKSSGTGSRASFARILRMQRSSSGSSPSSSSRNDQTQVFIRLLEPSTMNPKELIDNGDENSVELATKATNLSDHIILLKGSDFKMLEYSKQCHDTFILRKRKMTPSQLI